MIELVPDKIVELVPDKIVKLVPDKIVKLVPDIHKYFTFTDIIVAS